MKRIILIIALGFTLIISIGFWTFFKGHYNTASYITNSPEVGFQIIDNGIYKIVTPIGWKDKGYWHGSHGELYGTIEKNGIQFKYSYGWMAGGPTETLHEFLYDRKLNLSIMGIKKFIKEKEGMAYYHEWPPNTNIELADTIRTGRITGDLIKKYPYDNYYSITQLNDSAYFIPIDVPEQILNSEIENIILDEMRYNIVTPIIIENGFTKVSINKDDSPFCFNLYADNVAKANQDILIQMALSTQFKGQQIKSWEFIRETFDLRALDSLN
ncbi:MAG: hypothetical protein ACI9DK_001643 [Vicingaceae bacterium]|jgi:hypothetical protein